MDTISVWAVLLATLAQFVVGMVWYTAIFGKAWGKIHGFDTLSKEKQKEMMSVMGPFYGAQFIVSILTSVVLAKLIGVLPEYSPYALAAMVWVGFIIPTQYSDVAFGGTQPQWIVKKLLILASGALVTVLVAAAVIQAF